MVSVESQPLAGLVPRPAQVLSHSLSNQGEKPSSSFSVSPKPFLSQPPGCQKDTPLSQQQKGCSSSVGTPRLQSQRGKR